MAPWRFVLCARSVLLAWFAGLILLHAGGRAEEKKQDPATTEKDAATPKKEEATPVLHFEGQGIQFDYPDRFELQSLKSKPVSGSSVMRMRCPGNMYIMEVFSYDGPPDAKSVNALLLGDYNKAKEHGKQVLAWTNTQRKIAGKNITGRTYTCGPPTGGGAFKREYYQVELGARYYVFEFETCISNEDRAWGIPQEKALNMICESMKLSEL